MIYFFLVLLILAVVLVGFYIYVNLEKAKIQKRNLENVSVLQITVPKDEVLKSDEVIKEQGRDFKEEIAPADQLILSLHSLYDESFIKNFLQDQPIIGLEIVANHNLITFYVTCSKDLVTVIERQINSIYPDANIEQVEGHNIFSDKKGEFVCGTIGLKKKFIYPINTYKYLDKDPLNSLTNAMSKLGMDSGAAIQILIKPTDNKWRNKSNSAIKQVMEGKNSYELSKGQKAFQSAAKSFSKGIGSLFSSGKDSDDSREDRQYQQNPADEELMKAFAEKAGKPGFLTQIRLVAVAPDVYRAQTILDSMGTAFAQFNAPSWNSFVYKRCKDNKRRVVTDYALRNFDNAPTMILNSEEIASIFHFPNRFIETPNIHWLRAKLLPPPSNLPEEGVIIGETNHRGEKKFVRLKEDDRRRHLFMIGKTGVGKTTFFENMIDQDIAAGKGVCFMDPNGDAVESILQKIPEERAQDVILFDPGDTEYPMGLNLLEWRTPEEKDFLIAEWLEIFYKLFDPNRTGMVGPQFEHWGRNAALTVMSIPGGGSLIDIPRLFTDDNFKDYAISYVKDPVVKAFWQQQMEKTADFHKSEMFNYFISKFGRFMTNDLMRNIIGQAKSSINIREAMDSGKILLINLSKGKIGDTNANLLGLILVSKIQTAAFSRAEIPEDQRKDFYLYVDEFQNFTTDTFATILSEARKYRLNLHVTNQYIAQLPENIRDAVIGNAGSMVVYRIGAADAEFMTKEFPGVNIDDMVNLEMFNMYVKILIDATPTAPFSMKGLKSTVEKNPERAEAIRQLSRTKYALTKQEVEQEFIKRFNIASQKAPDQTPPREAPTA